MTLKLKSISPVLILNEEVYLLPREGALLSVLPLTKTGTLKSLTSFIFSVKKEGNNFSLLYLSELLSKNEEQENSSQVFKLIFQCNVVLLDFHLTHFQEHIHLFM
jgi:hypothetical protein